MTDLYVLSGFLGAGKTSLLQHVLNSGVDAGTVVLVNEFGALGLDGKLLERDGLPLYELNSGCICCTINDELDKVLKDILEKCRPQRILVEASGVADPANIAQTVNHFPPDMLRLAKCVVVLDCRMWKRRALLGHLFADQLSEADLLVLNKTDLLSSKQTAAIEDDVRRAFPNAITVKAVHGQIDLDTFWPISPRRLAHGRFLLSCFHEKSAHAFKQLVFTSNHPFDRKKLLSILSSLPNSLYRAKGQILFSDETTYIDIVSEQISWSKPPKGLQGTCLVFIGGDDFVPESMKTRLEQALLETEQNK